VQVVVGASVEHSVYGDTYHSENYDMGLTKRQMHVINGFIQNDVQDALKGRKRKDELLRRGELQERLVEAGPDAYRVDFAITDEVVTTMVDNTGHAMAMEFVEKFVEKFFMSLARLMNNHAMAYDKVDAYSLRDELEDFAQEDMMHEAQECVTDIVTALEKYAKNIGELAVHMAGGTEADEVRDDV